LKPSKPWIAAIRKDRDQALTFPRIETSWKAARAKDSNNTQPARLDHRGEPLRPAMSAMENNVTMAASKSW
jgi:hypothetical protein